jgi:hypothetical protein
MRFIYLAVPKVPVSEYPKLIADKGKLVSLFKILTGRVNTSDLDHS